MPPARKRRRAPADDPEPLDAWADRLAAAGPPITAEQAARLVAVMRPASPVAITARPAVALGAAA